MTQRRHKVAALALALVLTLAGLLAGTSGANAASYRNGYIPKSQLCSIGKSVGSKHQTLYLRCDAARDFKKLAAAYKKRFGKTLPVDLAYRSYSEQVQMRARYGRGAAVPGTSNHGWGTAVDFPDFRYRYGGGVNSKDFGFGGKSYVWLKANGPKFGWVAPKWAQQNGSLPESWHAEYVR